MRHIKAALIGVLIVWGFLLSVGLIALPVFVLEHTGYVILIPVYIVTLGGAVLGLTMIPPIRRHLGTSGSDEP